MIKNYYLKQGIKTAWVIKLRNFFCLRIKKCFDIEKFKLNIIKYAKSLKFNI